MARVSKAVFDKEYEHAKKKLTEVGIEEKSIIAILDNSEYVMGVLWNFRTFARPSKNR